MDSYDVAWNVMCYVAAIAVAIGFVLYLLTEIRAGKERRQKLWEDQQMASQEEQQR